MSEISFADLRCRFQTGRSYIVSGEGRNRVYGYRNGVQCALGDLERSQWSEMASDLIERKGEQELYKKLKVRRWKDKVWELGGLGGFSKKKLADPSDPKYIENGEYFVH